MEGMKEGMKDKAMKGVNNIMQKNIEVEVEVEVVLCFTYVSLKPLTSISPPNSPATMQGVRSIPETLGRLTPFSRGVTVYVREGESSTVPPIPVYGILPSVSR